MLEKVDAFLKLSETDAISLINDIGRPITGIFIPNGTRRLVLIQSPYPSSQEVYIKTYISLSKKWSLNVLKIFFNYGIKNLIIPLFSRSVLKRGNWYLQIVTEIIKIIFNDSDYLELYKKYKIAVKVYGNSGILKDICLKHSFDIIQNCIQQTALNGDNRLFLGIGGVDEIGTNLMNWGIRYYETNNSFPSLSEQKLYYYGENIPEAEFVITSSSLKAHSLPPLICGRSTNLYYLPCPSLIGLNDITYRKILIDLIFRRNDIEIDFSNLSFDKNLIKELGNKYKRQIHDVLGLGDLVGPFWVLKER